MSINTIESLYDKLDAEIAWRIKEMIDLKSLVLASYGQSNHDTTLRSGITLIYAHWEGFVKNALSYYLEFIAKQRLRYNVLKPCFLALTLKKKLDEFEKSSSLKSRIHNDIINTFHNLEKEESQVPYKKQIDTKSNLNSELFVDLMQKVGLDYSQYDIFFTMIDAELLNMRNQIAHGSRLEAISLDKESYQRINDRIIEIIEKLKDEIMDYAQDRKYMI
ncbi:MAE_28990/MAE_18760 family HEPN-like nuclease [Dielma fastidiosa]|uniref:MAE_28990/MAE_18760 family HEPN-like nuclease n=1 Tax=Dielma fastidiosa TaxID=1034346 RepID=UPI00356460C6